MGGHRKDRRVLIILPRTTAPSPFSLDPMEDTHDDEDDQEEQELEKLYSQLEGAAQDLAISLKADTVQILITRHCHKTGQSESYAAGRGNVYARIENCRTFVRNKDRD